MEKLTDLNFSTIALATITVSISLAATYNSTMLFALAIAIVIGILVVRKKIIQTFFLLPFLFFSFVPSTFVPSLNLITPIGLIRPSIISIVLFIVVLTLHKLFKLDLTIIYKNKALFAAIFLFFFINFISTIINGFDFNNFRVIFFVLILSFFVLFFVSATGRSINADTALKIALKTSAIVASLGIIEFFGVQPYLKLYLLNRDWYYYNNEFMDGLPRVVSSMGNPLVLSGYLLLCFPMILLVREQSKNKLFWNISILLHALCILFTQSRSAILILITVTFIYLFKSVKLGKLIKNLIFISVLMGLFYFILNSFGLIQSFYDRLLFRTDSESYTVRVHSFNTIVNILNNTSPLFGLGSNSVVDYVENTGILISTTLDNTFLTVLASSGMLGLASFLLIILVLWRCFSRLSPSYRFAGYLLVIIFIGLGFSYNTTVYESVWGVLWFFAGMLILLNNQEPKPQNLPHHAKL